MRVTQGKPFRQLLNGGIKIARFLRYGEVVLWNTEPLMHRELAEAMARLKIAKPAEDFDAGMMIEYDGCVALYGQSVSLSIPNIPDQRRRTKELLQPLCPCPLMLK